MAATLPNMSYDSLINHKPGVIGYATTLVVSDIDPAIVGIQHHGNTIAVMSPTRIQLSNCGWHTRTTSDRLHAIAYANGLGMVCIRQGRMKFAPADNLKNLRDFEEILEFEVN